MIRITGGSARGRVLRVPVVDGVRPTAERVREALFSAVGQDLAGVRFLDACAGSGAIALEAWSRGADVVACERDRSALVALRRGVELLGARLRIVTGDVRHQIASLGRFDMAWVDPPWDQDVAGLAAAIAPSVDGTLIVEWEVGRSLPERLGDLALRRERRYGRTAVWEYAGAERESE